MQVPTHLRCVGGPRLWRHKLGAARSVGGVERRRRGVGVRVVRVATRLGAVRATPQRRPQRPRPRPQPRPRPRRAVPRMPRV